LREDDRLYLPDPVYQGGTVDQSRGSDWLAAAIEELGGKASHLPTRGAIGDALLRDAAPGDRIVVMGARDDTLSDFAAELIAGLGTRR
jgi:UDP-N-acetylmuramate--alanine ligase